MGDWFIWKSRRGRERGTLGPDQCHPMAEPVCTQLALAVLLTLFEIGDGSWVQAWADRFLYLCNCTKLDSLSCMFLSLFREYRVQDGKIFIPLNITVQGDVVVSMYHLRSTIGSRLQAKVWFWEESWHKRLWAFNRSISGIFSPHHLGLEGFVVLESARALKGCLCSSPSFSGEETETQQGCDLPRWLCQKVAALELLANLAL